MSRSLFHQQKISDTPIDTELTEPVAAAQRKLLVGKPFIEKPLPSAVTPTPAQKMTIDELWEEFCDFHGLKISDQAVQHARYGAPQGEFNKRSAEVSKQSIAYLFASGLRKTFGSNDLAREAMKKSRSQASIDDTIKLADQIGAFRFDRHEKSKAAMDSTKLTDIFAGRDAVKIIAAIENQGQLSMPSWAKLVITCMPKLEKSIGFAMTPQNAALMLANVGSIKNLHDKLPVAMRSPITDYLDSLPGLGSDGSPSAESFTFHMNTVGAIRDMLADPEQEVATETN